MWSAVELQRVSSTLRLCVLSLWRARAHAQDRWHLIGEAQEQALSKKFVPKNTASTKWAMSNFTSWIKGRKERFPDDPVKQVPHDLLLSDDGASRF